MNFRSSSFFMSQKWPNMNSDVNWLVYGMKINVGEWITKWRKIMERFALQWQTITKSFKEIETRNVKEKFW